MPLSLCSLITSARRVLAAAALLAGIAASPAMAEVFNPATFTLANGLQVVVVENHRAPVATHMVWYKVGAADEPLGKSGIAHFLEHLMFKGTSNVPVGEFSAQVARVGGNENAFTTQDYTAYFQTVAVENLELVMRLEADRMANLELDDSKVLPEREVILEERSQRIDNDPGSQLGEMARAVLFLNHPYRLPTIGWEHEMRGLTTEDAIAFYRRWYAPNNAVLVIVGDVTADQVRPLAEKYYGAVPTREVPARIRLAEPPHVAARQVVLESPRVQQPSWTRTYLAPSYYSGATEHAYALEVLAEILGGGPTSRLYRHLVVEQGIATGIGAWYGPDAVDLGTFGFSASPQPGAELPALQAAIEAELAAFLANGVTEAELAAAKTLLQAGAVKARDSLSNPARSIGATLATGGTIEDIEAWPDRIGAVTVDQVNAAARYVLKPESSVTSLLLPKETS
jgi:zinc protease